MNTEQLQKELRVLRAVDGWLEAALQSARKVQAPNTLGAHIRRLRAEVSTRIQNINRALKER